MKQASSGMETKAQILEATDANIERAAARLKAEQVVGVPSETVYGLAGDATNPQALLKIFETKKRPKFDPLIVHVAPKNFSHGRLENVGSEIAILQTAGVICLDSFGSLARERVEKLIHSFWPGPLTLVLPKGPAIPDLATSGLDSVAVRMPRHPVFQKLLQAFGGPLAAPSANRFGGVSPTTAGAVQSELGDRISIILDGGPSEIGVESTILMVSPEGYVRLLRPGGVGLEEIERVVGARPEDHTFSVLPGGPHLAPGLLKHHYAPSKPMILAPRPFLELSPAEWAVIQRATERASRIGILQMGIVDLERSPLPAANLAEIRRHLPAGTQVQEWTLSKDGTVRSAAFYLFATLREFDLSTAQVLIAEPPTTREGLGFALFDRLARASTQQASVNDLRSPP